MFQLIATLKANLSQIPGRFYLFFAVTIFAAANAIANRLGDLGHQYLIDGRNPISFCNILFVGNLCALLTLLVLYRQTWTHFDVRQLCRKDWLNLTIVAVLSGAIAPALIVSALQVTMVNNVVLLGQVETPLILALSVWLLKERINRWIVIGALVTLLGVGITTIMRVPFIQTPLIQTGSDGTSFSLGLGEILILGGAIASGLATAFGKAYLRPIPLGVFMIYRTAIGTIVFFTIAYVIFGPMHFQDVFSPLVWKWMLIYGAVIIVGGQMSWFFGLRHASATEVSLANSFEPIAGILSAYFIVGEIPTIGQMLGAIVIVVGIVFGQVGVLSLNQKQAIAPITPTIDTETSMGFKGI